MPSPFTVENADRPDLPLLVVDRAGNLTANGALRAAGLYATPIVYVGGGADPVLLGIVTGEMAPRVSLTAAGALTVRSVEAAVAAVGDVGITGRVVGDANARFAVYGSGRIEWGVGAFGRDTVLERTAAGVLGTTGSISLTAAGGGILIKEGADATSGMVALIGGTKVINTTKITANSRVHVTVQELGTVATAKAVAVVSRTPGASFRITSEDATDTSNVAWMIVEPA